MLALRSGLTKRLCEDFVRELFQIVSASLADGENVKIKDIGTFRVSRVEARKSVDVATGEPVEIPGHAKVVFVPAKSLAEGINAPFEAFVAVEVPVGYELTDEDPEEVYYQLDDDNDELSADVKVKTDAEEWAEVVFPPPFDPVALVLDSAQQGQEPKRLASKVEVFAADGHGYDKRVSTEDDTVPRHHMPKQSARKKNYRFGWGVFVGFSTCLIVVVLTGLVFFGNVREKIQDGSAPEIPPIEIADASSAHVSDATTASEGEAVEPYPDTKPSDISSQDSQKDSTSESGPVYDTITRTRYLTTIAKEHYGNFNLWPYIYEENKAILGHPDRIKPGTRVVVPPLSKYGVDAHSKADIEKARKKGVDIYARYSDAK